MWVWPFGKHIQTQCIKYSQLPQTHFFSLRAGWGGRRGGVGPKPQISTVSPRTRRRKQVDTKLTSCNDNRPKLRPNSHKVCSVTFHLKWTVPLYSSSPAETIFYPSCRLPSVECSFGAVNSSPSRPRHDIKQIPMVTDCKSARRSKLWRRLAAVNCAGHETGEFGWRSVVANTTVTVDKQKLFFFIQSPLGEGHLDKHSQRASY